MVHLFLLSISSVVFANAQDFTIEIIHPYVLTINRKFEVTCKTNCTQCYLSLHWQPLEGSKLNKTLAKSKVISPKDEDDIEKDESYLEGAVWGYDSDGVALVSLFNYYALANALEGDYYKSRPMFCTSISADNFKKEASAVVYVARNEQENKSIRDKKKFPGPWSPFSECRNSHSCLSPGGDPEGTKNRTRICHPEKQCVSSQSKECEMKACENGPWSSWTSCRPSCHAANESSNGFRERRRECNNDTDAPCKETDRKSCPLEPCPPVGSWGAWTACPRSCYTEGSSKTDTQTRVRECEIENCEAEEVKTCELKPCPINGNWGLWGKWGVCPKCDATAETVRNRVCDNPAPKYGGNECHSAASQTKKCIPDASCGTDGSGIAKWGAWGQWSSCGVTCNVKGESKRERTRKRQCGGSGCPGVDSEVVLCDIPICVIDGNWGGWSHWKPCVKTCGSVDFTTSTRKCDSPPPEFGGRQCVGESTRNRQCPSNKCPVDGVWMQWSSWFGCSATCETTGVQRRHRECYPPQHGGRHCLQLDNAGKAMEEKKCNSAECPAPGVWGTWILISRCSATCGKSYKIFQRKCKGISEGRECAGKNKKKEECSTEYPECPVNGRWASWYDWSPCSEFCLSPSFTAEGYVVGIQNRVRTCSNPIPELGGKDCFGKSRVKKPCLASMSTQNHENISCSGTYCIRHRYSKTAQQFWEKREQGKEHLKRKIEDAKFNIRFGKKYENQDSVSHSLGAAHESSLKSSPEPEIPESKRNRQRKQYLKTQTEFSNSLISLGTPSSWYNHTADCNSIEDSDWTIRNGQPNW